MKSMIEYQGQEVEVMSKDAKDLIEPWINSLDVKPISKKAYAKNITIYLDWLADNGLSGAEREDVLRYKAWLQATREASTITAYMSAVRMFYTWLQANGLHGNIATGIKGAKAPECARRDALSTEQAKRLLACIDRSSVEGMRDYAIISIMLHTGLRSIEVQRADVCDLRQMDGHPVLYIQGKGRDEKDQFVVLAPSVNTAVREYLKARGVKDTAREPLFCSQSNRNDGGRMATGSISRIVKTALRSAGIDSERITCHALRTSCITMALRSGATVQEVQDLARHKSVETTIRHYARNMEHASNRAWDLIETALE